MAETTGRMVLRHARQTVVEPKGLMHKSHLNGLAARVVAHHVQGGVVMAVVEFLPPNATLER
eukprot:gene9169-44811_t